ncbi:uncharacterized protein LOC117239844 [Bombus vosnesenskii]|uniref:Uncharacterized protein LOC117239777 n=1 Tax=Bombus vosnesenskii TaxID=207650 RepID=A0A6J3L8D7_9HYME|nr:uncharacterized protein LOC117239777 [Bombus vosnesenskii]XP_033361564.1 uncharacterized protein LOC117239844 [Bombus vosnesenskii]
MNSHTPQPKTHGFDRRRSDPYSQMHSSTSKGTPPGRAPNVAILSTIVIGHEQNIYPKDFDALLDHVMFPAEKSAVLNTLARGATGKTIVPGTVNILGMMDKNTLTTIAKIAVSGLWTGFMEFGTVSAAIFGILTIFKLIKTIIDIAGHGYQLRETYGCGAIYGPVTHPLLYLKRRRDIDDQKAQPQGISITPVVVQLPTTPASASSELRDTISQISYGNLNSKGGVNIRGSASNTMQ